jgi:hypothetical protein
MLGAMGMGVEGLVGLENLKSAGYLNHWLR